MGNGAKTTTYSTVAVVKQGEGVVL